MDQKPNNKQEDGQSAPSQNMTRHPNQNMAPMQQPNINRQGPGMPTNQHPAYHPPTTNQRYSNPNVQAMPYSRPPGPLDSGLKHQASIQYQPGQLTHQASIQIPRGGPLPGMPYGQPPGQRNPGLHSQPSIGPGMGMKQASISPYQAPTQMHGQASIVNTSSGFNNTSPYDRQTRSRNQPISGFQQQNNPGQIEQVPQPVKTVTKSSSRANVNKVAEYCPPKLQNLVSTANLNCQLELKVIAFKCRNAEYNPKRFAAVIMRMKEPNRTTALIFKTGKMVITGAKSIEDSKNAAKLYEKAIKKVGFKVGLSNFEIQNMVGSCSVSFKIQLEKLNQSQQKKGYCDFHPETFPGLIFHMESPAKICLLIFESGKIVLTGAKTRQAIDDAFTTIQPLLRKYEKVSLRDDSAVAQQPINPQIVSNDRRKGR